MLQMSSLRVLFGKNHLCICRKKKYNFYQTYRKHHISKYFLRKINFHYSFFEKISYFQEKEIASFLIMENRSFLGNFFTKIIFSEHLKKISYFYVFFWRRSSFIFCLNNKIVFSGGKKYHLSWWYKKDHIPVEFYSKDHLFRKTGKRKYGFCRNVMLLKRLNIINFKVNNTLKS